MKKSKNIVDQMSEGMVLDTKGLLSVVATPIGNLADITLRALETLKQADAIACEDTRVSSKLLARYDIQKPLLVYHAQRGPTTARATMRILSMLGEGKHIALVTDAGTPGISDPGSALVAEVRTRLGDDVHIVSIPGPSAIAAALSIAGIDRDDFTFLGFLPHKKGRQTIMKEIAAMTRTVVFYESPHRIEKGGRKARRSFRSSPGFAGRACRRSAPGERW